MNLNDIAHANQVPPGKKTGLILAGILTFPVALAAGIATALMGIGLYAIGVVALIWIIILRLLYGAAGLKEPSKVIGLTVGIGSLTLVGEVFAGFALLSASGYIGFANLATAYVIVAGIVSIALVRIMRGRGISTLLPAPISEAVVHSPQPTNPGQVSDPGVFESTPPAHTVETNDDQTPKPPAPPAV